MRCIVSQQLIHPCGHFDCTSDDVLRRVLQEGDVVVEDLMEAGEVAEEAEEAAEALVPAVACRRGAAAAVAEVAGEA